MAAPWERRSLDPDEIVGIAVCDTLRTIVARSDVRSQVLDDACKAGLSVLEHEDIRGNKHWEISVPVKLVTIYYGDGHKLQYHYDSGG